MRPHPAPRRAATWLAAALVLAALVAASCGPRIRRFPLADPLWEDRDRNHVPERPAKYYSGMIADVADKQLFRALADLFYFHLDRPSINVNAVDEVPNSAWFTNRIGLFPITPARVREGACAGLERIDPTRGPWKVVEAKPDGANPGFFIKAPQGKFLLKFDSPVQPQRATAADVIGSRVYWAAGYWTPCNEVVYFRREILHIAADAVSTSGDGEETPLTEADINKALRSGFRLKNGMIRASASRFLPGRPIGPFSYLGTRSDDPNDVVPHQHRRELRASRLLAAWLNHHDAREQNSLNVWVERGGRTYVRHYMIDFGDCFGGRWAFDALSRRLGHSHFLDYGHVLGDILSLGIIERPWHRAEINEEAEMFGYFDVDNFVASEWKPAYKHPALDRMRFDDALWMVRILSRFTADHVRAAVAAGKLTDARAERYLIRTLLGRRRKILSEYLRRYAPLADFRLVRRTPGDRTQSLCFRDLAIHHGAVNHRHVVYKLKFHGGEELEEVLGWLQFTPDPDHPGRSCVVLPIGDRRPHDLAPGGSRDDHPLRYGELRFYIHQKPSVPPTSSMSVYLYDLGPGRGYRIVGARRHDEPVMPDIY